MRRAVVALSIVVVAFLALITLPTLTSAEPIQQLRLQLGSLEPTQSPLCGLNVNSNFGGWGSSRLYLYSSGEQCAADFWRRGDAIMWWGSALITYHSVASQEEDHLNFFTYVGGYHEDTSTTSWCWGCAPREVFGMAGSPPRSPAQLGETYTFNQGAICARETTLPFTGHTMFLDAENSDLHIRARTPTRDAGRFYERCKDALRSHYTNIPWRNDHNANFQGWVATSTQPVYEFPIYCEDIRLQTTTIRRLTDLEGTYRLSTHGVRLASERWAIRDSGSRGNFEFLFNYNNDTGRLSGFTISTQITESTNAGGIGYELVCERASPRPPACHELEEEMHCISSCQDGDETCEEHWGDCPGDSACVTCNPGYEFNSEFQACMRECDEGHYWTQMVPRGDDTTETYGCFNGIILREERGPERIQFGGNNE